MARTLRGQGHPAPAWGPASRGQGAHCYQAAGTGSKARRAHQAQGTAGQEAPRGAPTGDSRSEVRAAWARPPHPGRGLEGTAGRRAEGKRAGTSHLLTKPPPPPAFGEKCSFPQLRKILFAGRKKGNPEALYSGARCSLPAAGASPSRPRGPRQSPLLWAPTPTQDTPGGEACGDRMGHGTPRSVPRPHLPTGLTS